MAQLVVARQKQTTGKRDTENPRLCVFGIGLPAVARTKWIFVSLACLPSVFVQFICAERHFFTLISSWNAFVLFLFPLKNHR